MIAKTRIKATNNRPATCITDHNCQAKQRLPFMNFDIGNRKKYQIIIFMPPQQELGYIQKYKSQPSLGHTNRSGELNDPPATNNSFNFTVRPATGRPSKQQPCPKTVNPPHPSLPDCGNLNQKLYATGQLPGQGHQRSHNRSCIEKLQISYATGR